MDAEMTAPRWYVVNERSGGDAEDMNDDAWTLSLFPDRAGWCTDGGYSGYGLTKSHAEELASAANSMWELRQMMFGGRAVMGSPADLGLRLSTDLSDNRTFDNG